MDETDWKAEADAIAAERHEYDPIAKPDRRFTAGQILEAVCERHRVTMDGFLGRNRTKPLVNARTEYVGAARELTECSYPQIARAMSRRSHSTCCHAHNRWVTLPKAERLSVLREVRSIALGRHGRTQ